MTVETETILINLLEELKSDFKELKTEVKELRQDVNKVNVSLARLEEKTASLQTGQDAINAKLNTQQTWFLTLLTGLRQ